MIGSKPEVDVTPSANTYHNDVADGSGPPYSSAHADCKRTTLNTQIPRNEFFYLCFALTRHCTERVLLFMNGKKSLWKRTNFFLIELKKQCKTVPIRSSNYTLRIFQCDLNTATFTSSANFTFALTLKRLLRSNI